MGRLDKEGLDALVRLPEPVNRFPDFVRCVVRRLKIFCSTLGKVKTAQILTRAGLHLGPTTVRRMQWVTRWPEPRRAAQPTPRIVPARKPNHLWHVDLTTVPTALGFWISWVPFALPQVCPFCWWPAVVVKPFSRRVMGFAVYREQPPLPQSGDFSKVPSEGRERCLRTSYPTRALDSSRRGFRRWCHREGIRHRFGALGRYRSLAVIARSIRTIKTECTRRLILVPYRLAASEQELALYSSFYNRRRPHMRLRATTPDEIYHHRRLVCRSPRFEPRPRWPRLSRCAVPQALIRGQPGAKLDLSVRFHPERPHPPIVTLKSVHFDPTFDEVGARRPYASPKAPVFLLLAVPILHFRATEATKLPHSISVDYYTFLCC